MKKILIATTNLNKLREFQELFSGTGFDLITPSELNIDLTVEEDGNTYEENAAKKALAYLSKSGLITLADDSGLEVDSLDGAPGVHSARYSPLPGATDLDRRMQLLKSLRNKPQPWKAHFHATIAIAYPDRKLAYAAGDCYGEIITEERGVNGFGYDPIFYLPELDKTMAELCNEEKNRISHRALAARAAILLL